MGICQSEIRMLQMDGQHDKALNKLLKIKMSGEELKLSDEIFVNHCIAWHYNKNNNNLREHYINLNKKIFDNEQNRQDYKVEYVRYLWLYSDIYEEKLSLEKYNSIFLTIYKEYKDMNNIYFSKCALFKVLIKKGVSKDILKYIKYNIDKKEDGKLINDMVEECNKLNHHTYINARQLVATM